MPTSDRKTDKPDTGQSPASLHALRLTEARWGAILDTVRDAIISIDRSGRILLFNRFAEQIFGYRAEEVVGQNVSMLMPSPYREEHDEYIHNYERTGVAKAIGRIRDVQARRQNGEIFPIELSVSEARIEDEVVYMGIIRDVTERRRTEEALRRERDFAERLIETAQAIVLVLDTEGRIVLFNPYMEDVSGFRLAEMQGKDWFSGFIPAGGRRDARKRFDVAIEGTVLQSYTSRILTRTGGVREVEWSSRVIKDGEGRVVGVLSVGQDVTERKRAEEELLKLQKLAQERERLADIGAITAKIAHDLGNPLSALSMQAQLILRRARREGSEPLSSVLAPIERLEAEVRRLESLIRELMAFSREQRLDLKTIDPGRFLQQIVDLWQPLASERGIALNLEIEGGYRSIDVDEDKLRRVLDNLVKNALEAITSSPGRVTIRFSLAGAGRVRISVEDTGAGVAPNVQVFRLFETTKANGSGLGLAVARQIIQAHGGDISFSPAEPHGTVFHVELPLLGSSAN